MMRFSGSRGALSEKGASDEKPRALAAALRAFNLQVCPHTTLSPYKKPVPTCVNTGLTCMLCGASSGPHLPAPASHPHARRTRKLHLCEALDTVLGDARKEQRLQLRSILAKDQSLAEDALALIKTAFVTG